MLFRSLPTAVLEVGYGPHEILDWQPSDRAVLGFALAIGIVAEAAGSEPNHLLAMRHDVRHHGVVAGKPVGRAKAVVDLFQGKGSVAARKVSDDTFVSWESSPPPAVDGSCTRTLSRIIDRRGGRRDIAVGPERKRSEERRVGKECRL